MLSAVKQKSFQLFSEHVQRNVRRSKFSWQTVPNYRAMYSKATAAVALLVRGTMSWLVLADRRLDRPVCDMTGVQYDARYGGAMP